MSDGNRGLDTQFGPCPWLSLALSKMGVGNESDEPWLVHKHKTDLTVFVFVPLPLGVKEECESTLEVSKIETTRWTHSTLQHIGIHEGVDSQTLRSRLPSLSRNLQAPMIITLLPTQSVLIEICNPHGTEWVASRLL